ncbi:hypothetical protein IV57_GL000742 [Companilactobacillus kimchiensis]|uniref:HTH cro/C1-type domain-containing protein n=2 Tax=Companilactobacillus kimchiensis TaxID=993692 RepID=A0A0R2LAE6_9LACO|nr:hypothetical protein IV57_GL000742 [Companilactobacillus kimchiensis]
MMTVGKYLKTKRFFKELTMRQVVDTAQDKYNFSTSTSVLSSIETDKNRVIDGELLLVLSEIYGFDMNELKELVLDNLKSNGRKKRAERE